MNKPLFRNSFRLRDGRDVQEATISGHGLSAKILTLGAVVRDLRLDGHAHSLVLGYEDVSSYLTNSGYLGAIVGRVANRINGGQFDIDGTRFQVDRNDSENALHGGANGTWALAWDIAEQGEDFIVLSLSLPDGHMGFPGRLDIQCRYTLLRSATLDIQITAKTDAPTLCNLAPHCYFNLDGQERVSDHLLQVRSDRIVPVDARGIPLGQSETVNPEMDFQRPRPADSVELDVNYCFDSADKLLQENACLTSTVSGRSLTVLSNQPGLQVFNAPKMTTAANGLNGQAYGAYCGVAFEPQIWPDAPNHPTFPSAVLRPGEGYLNHSQFRFT